MKSTITGWQAEDYCTMSDISEQAPHLYATILDIGSHLVPFEENGAPYFHNADTASNADFAALVQYPDATKRLIEVFDEGGRVNERHFSFRGLDTTDGVLAVAAINRTAIASVNDFYGTTPLPGMEISSEAEAEKLLQKYIVHAGLGTQALRANDYWLEETSY